MSRFPARNPLVWSTIGTLALLGAVLLAVALAVKGVPLRESLVAFGCGAVLLLMAWLWERTLRRARTAPSLTSRQRLWNVGVLVIVVAMMTALCWWYATHPE